MTGDNPGLDHSILHRDLHASRVRVVPNDEVEAATSQLQMLFPREAVLTAPMGCRHTCVYTHTAPASVVAERISAHLREVEHLAV